MSDAFDPAPPALLDCRRCARLVHWRERVAREKRRAYLDTLKALGHPLVKARHPFGHAHESTMPDGNVLLDTYHVSLRNTNAGKLTPAMLDAVLLRARDLAAYGPPGA